MTTYYHPLNWDGIPLPGMGNGPYNLEGIFTELDRLRDERAPQDH